VSLIGANGAGKSTTLRGLSGLLKPRAGSITFAGVEIAGEATHQIARRRLVQVPEGRQIFAEMTVAENLAMGAYLVTDKGEAKRRSDAVITRFPRLGERRTQLAGYLSGGEQQMLAIARALVRNPKIILLDEPFEGLAPVIVRDLVKACRDLADAGQTIVLVEQNLAAALTLAQRAYIINNGHIAHEGPTGEIKAQPKILERYLGV
jgi:branched-chain amino acid transport system ATP-binding protein